MEIKFQGPVISFRVFVNDSLSLDGRRRPVPLLVPLLVTICLLDHTVCIFLGRLEDEEWGIQNEAAGLDYLSPGFRERPSLPMRDAVQYHHW